MAGEQLLFYETWRLFLDLGLRVIERFEARCTLTWRIDVMLLPQLSIVSGTIRYL
jgi:hypothetical protein